METFNRPLRPAELAKALGCSRAPVDAAIRAGLIPAARIGRGLFIPHRVAVDILANGRLPGSASTQPSA